MTKKQLAYLYAISSSTLYKLLNETFYEELAKEGYTKKERILSPKVVRKFFELYGHPLNDTEI